MNQSLERDAAMGQSIGVAFKSIRAEYRRYKQRGIVRQRQDQERQHILAASAGSTPHLAVAFEDHDEQHLPDPPFL